MSLSGTPGLLSGPGRTAVIANYKDRKERYEAVVASAQGIPKCTWSAAQAAVEAARIAAREEVARLAVEEAAAEEARIAAEEAATEAARVAAEEEVARIDTEEKATKIAAEEAARMVAEEAARVAAAEEKTARKAVEEAAAEVVRIAAEEEVTRITAEEARIVIAEVTVSDLHESTSLVAEPAHGRLESTRPEADTTRDQLNSASSQAEDDSTVTSIENNVTLPGPGQEDIMLLLFKVLLPHPILVNVKSMLAKEKSSER